MKIVVESFDTTDTLILIDGKNKPSVEGNVKTLVNGDKREIAISAASIFAKVYRDHYMSALSLQHPLYFWGANKGYGTQKHRDAIEIVGVTQHHRVNYKPLQKYL